METRRFAFLLGTIAISVLALQTLTLPYRKGLIFFFPDGKISGNTKSISGEFSPSKSALLDNYSSVTVQSREALNYMGQKIENGIETKEKERNLKTDLLSDESSFDIVSEMETFESLIQKGKDTQVDSSEKVRKKEKISLKANIDSSIERGRKPKVGLSIMKIKQVHTISGNDEPALLQSGSITSTNLTMPSSPAIKKYRCNMPPKTVMNISEMNRLLLRRQASYRFGKTKSSSVRDSELLSAKSQIENAPVVRNDRDLYAPLFRNVSMFKRSYELMEHTLKVYVYKEGDKPIFHNAELKGIYASEGWFMKLMEGNAKFSVKDPRKAHLFYMPFSTRMLEYSLYVRNSHNRTNLAQYLKNYTHMIAEKYSFWNRTNGADHFFVACHDWAPYETRHHMERCIKSLCNADVTAGFKIGKDVSLPETYVRSVRNPVRDIGGNSPSNRSTLAFFAGSMHGYLRPILLSYWENKDPDMKILGRMPLGVASKMTYIQHMKSSKYCICAKGYNVNSPRVIEAVFYECVPVIISDNFVPPLFDVLNWESFSVIVAEKDIPILKDILLSIPYEKYLSLQLGVKRVQRHFVWHGKPVKYDLFHMILHSIWYTRVNMIRPK